MLDPPCVVCASGTRDVSEGPVTLRVVHGFDYVALEAVAVHDVGAAEVEVVDGAA